MEFDKALIEQSTKRAMAVYSSKRAKLFFAMVALAGIVLWCWIHATLPKYSYELRTDRSMLWIFRSLSSLGGLLFLYLIVHLNFISFRAFIDSKALRDPGSFYAYLRKYHEQIDREKDEKTRSEAAEKAKVDNEFDLAVKKAMGITEDSQNK